MFQSGKEIKDIQPEKSLLEIELLNKAESQLIFYQKFLNAQETLWKAAFSQFENRDKDRTIYLLEEMIKMSIHVWDYTLAIMTMKLMGEIYIIAKDFHKAI